ncbi:ABC transporter related [Desulfofarcimen acetoxidans DSM 771]|jgi:phosphate transport system ATP-binding protein|uniref:ABC transporter related n=1 Tax=Desulfofarcimen acetoxidans (strain ATCC 49208 / DSM 771 / KCTC 5769 / VKM B-1644 / 5575) TaxID=485916 RepID=C8W2T2_DESAS|nr:phosphate ABC transporter ATP-binding protein [Desulfofarcimen acetoxidans]ACV61088.1 ABC transporter related [Desulfofarcimen acetoxidans DSM 771]
MSVHLKNLCVFFNGTPVLKKINLEFKEQVIYAIVGPSGCGKTTLLRSINRTAELDRGFSCSGEILLYGKNIYQERDAAEIRRKIGIVFQTPVALPLSIKENVIFGIRYLGGANNKQLNYTAEHCLKQAGLWQEVKDKLHKPARELSGGQIQRLSIARTLAVNPEVLLLDEPCSNLDPVSAKLIEELLLSLSNRLTVILVTHNLFQARRIAQNTILMSVGCVVESGPTEVMFSTPDRQETKDYFSGLIW